MTYYFPHGKKSKSSRFTTIFVLVFLIIGIPLDIWVSCQHKREKVKDVQIKETETELGDVIWKSYINRKSPQHRR